MVSQYMIMGKYMHVNWKSWQKLAWCLIEKNLTPSFSNRTESSHLTLKLCVYTNCRYFLTKSETYGSNMECECHWSVDFKKKWQVCTRERSVRWRWLVDQRTVIKHGKKNDLAVRETAQEICPRISLTELNFRSVKDYSRTGQREHTPSPHMHNHLK